MKGVSRFGRRVAVWCTALLLILSVPFVIGAKFGLWLRRSDLAAPVPTAGPALKAWSDGLVDVCLFTRTPRKPAFPDGQVTLAIDGVLMGFGHTGKGSLPPPLPGTVVECEMGPDSHVDLDGYIDVEDTKHELWRVLYGLSGTTISSLATLVGSHVTLRFEGHWGFSRAAGFMLLDKAGLVIAVERGTFGRGLLPEHQRPFTVRLGETVARRTDHCGDALAHALQVSGGDSQVQVLPGREQDVFFDGVRYRLWNAQATTWENERCTDMLDQISWVLWRR